ncbi:MAG: serpin family protein [Acidimicrobiia bacterium]
MDRRHFLTLPVGLAALALLDACGDDGGKGESTGSSAPGPSAPSAIEPAAVGEARSSLRRAPSDPSSGTRGADAVNALGVDLYQQIRSSSPTQNFVFSPASIMLALAMTRAGASGTTAAEMDAVLHSALVGSDPTALHTAMNALSSALDSRSGDVPTVDGVAKVELSIANSLWGQQDITWLPPFLDRLAAEYGAGMRLVDYTADAEAARVAINAWVDDQTKHRISELLSRGSIDRSTRLALVNAVYLKAPWLIPFDVSATVAGPFTAATGETVQAPTMQARRRLPYTRGPNWQAVEIPYIGGSLAMMVIVPDAGALSAVEVALTDGLIADAASAFTAHQVNLGLPKFDIETNLSLSEMMAALGMPTAFSSSADFSAMTADERLAISAIIHQANITVDEVGTEAAAAAAMMMPASGSAIAPEVVDLNIDRPFLYALRDVPTGAVLFLGRISDPTQRR